MNTGAETKPFTIAPLNFQAEVLESRLPVLVEFWTSWSRPCRISDLVLQELARELAGKIKVAKINADDSLELSLCYEIHSIPTLIFFRDGKAQFRVVGTASKEAILEKLNSFSTNSANLRQNEKSQ